MRIIRSARQMSALSRRFLQQDRRVGVVPTMGALHDGHLSLIRAARAENDVVSVTIFVNPLQCGPHEDYACYPRSLRKDLRLARAAGADIIFAPTAKQMYPDGFQTSVEVGPLAQRWEGHSRPGHFRGVATAVTILFELTRPTAVYVGQKDYQQALIVRQLVRDLHLPLQVRMLPTMREPDGLAMSSRNVCLIASEREQARVLYRALCTARERIHAGERRAAAIIEEMRHLISEAPSARIDYVTVVDAKTLASQWRLRGRVAILLAVWIGRTRVIDNILVDVP